MVGMSGRLLGVTWIAGLVAACGSDPGTAGIQVVPGTTIQVAEGKTATAYLLLDGEPGQRFELPADPDAIARLNATVSTTDDVTALQVTPSCAAIATGGARRIEELTIRAVDSDAAPLAIIVEIEPSEEGLCAVAVVGWPGPCTTRPLVVPPEIALDITSPTQPVCIEVYVPESVLDLDVTFPSWASLEPLQLTGAPLLDLGPGSHTRELTAISVDEKFRGRRELEVRWGAAGAASLSVVSGEPGLGQLRIRGGPPSLTEYKRATYPTSVSYFEQPGTVACVRANPQTTDTRLVVRTDQVTVTGADMLACDGTINNLELVPGIGSSATEHVDVELLKCTQPSAGCADPRACCEGSTLEQLDTAVISLPARSVAETLTIASGSDRACVDLDDDDVPEIVVREASATRVHRATVPTVNSVRFAQPVTTSVTPLSMLALRWFNGLSVKPVLLGEFANELRIAIPTGWSSATFELRPSASEPAHRWVPLEPTRGGGASYLAVKQSGSVISLVCISPGCSSDGDPIDVASVLPGPSATTISGYGVFDLRGDGDLDLVLALDTVIPIDGARKARLYSVDLEWQGHTLTRQDPPAPWANVTTTVSWNTLQFVALPRTGAEDAVYMLAQGSDFQNVLVEIALPSVQIIDTIGRPFEVADVGGSVFVGTDLGVWELTTTDWIQRDPERALMSSSSFPIPDPSSGYGRGLRSCLTAPSAPASLVFDAVTDARWVFDALVVESVGGP